ncbi:auxin response factor 16-like [Humulus lupulus]|uniref:auxin response factor 16-like n=1 Tax=Humulus lupulus TaxID=3486 RepID=UPI002B409F97|nr:auxin response factor 16-like [Humulus lupulus]
MNGPGEGGERSNLIDPLLWHACAGRLVHVPPLNSKAFYFPQGHAEHATTNADCFTANRVPSKILCRVNAVEFKADCLTDEVFTKISLVPVPSEEESDSDEENENDASSGGVLSGNEGLEKPKFFAKTLTQSDANNGCGFSVPKQCAETIFPPLDYSKDPPVQTLCAKDVHDRLWKFRHIYRGTPRRHLLTTGWSNFVNKKKLVCGDSIVFLKANNGDVSVGIRRVKRGNERAEVESSSGWNNSPSLGGLSRNQKRILNLNSYRNSGRVGRIRPESFIKAANLAANGKPFEVVYYPTATTAAFCVKASVVHAVMRRHWFPGTRFKMAFETDYSSRVNWFMGTVSSVKEVDPSRWPRSLWRVLEVTWDDENFLQNVKRINPWLVQVTNTEYIQLSSFLPPRQKYRLSQSQQSDITHEGGQLSLSSPLGNSLGLSNPLGYPSNNTPASIQGARQILLFGQCIDIGQKHCNSPPSFSQVTDGRAAEYENTDTERSPSNNSGPTLHPTGNAFLIDQTRASEGLSSFLTIGNSGQSLERSNNAGNNPVVLFGQRIDIGQKNCDIPPSFSQVTAAEYETTGTERSPYDSGPTPQPTENGLNLGHRKIFIESNDSGLTNGISFLGSYEGLFKNLSDSYQTEGSQMQNPVVYY